MEPFLLTSGRNRNSKLEHVFIIKVKCLFKKKIIKFLKFYLLMVVFERNSNSEPQLMMINNQVDINDSDNETYTSAVT